MVDALNPGTFIGFLGWLLEKIPRFVLVLDNAGYHKSGKASRFIESTNGSIRLIFLPPHTPQLNPIEIQWIVPKRLLACRYFETLDELRDAIGAIIRGEMKPVRLMPYMTGRYTPA